MSEGATLEIKETNHYNELSEGEYESLMGIDDKKAALLNTLVQLLNKNALHEWHKKHHGEGLTFFANIINGLPLVILEGDVGCGKTALAQSIGSPLSKQLDKAVTVFETPSNIRGGGKVGGISDRITETFKLVKARLRKGEYGILLIDEGDDLATSREQTQAHHEDRAGLNVLIKQIDVIVREKVNLAIILITNRLNVIDPAIIRRAVKILHFERPEAKAREQLFKSIFKGTEIKQEDLEALVSATEISPVLYSYSDLVQKVGRESLHLAVERDTPFTKELYLEVLSVVKPSPKIN